MSGESDCTGFPLAADGASNQLVLQPSAKHRECRLGSYLAVPLTSGGGLLFDMKLKKHDQELTLSSKVGWLLESSHTPLRPQTPAYSQEATFSGELVEAISNSMVSGHCFG